MFSFPLLLVGTCSAFIDFDHFDVGVAQWNQHNSNEPLTFLRFSDSQDKNQFLPGIFSQLHFVNPSLTSKNTELSNDEENMLSDKKDYQDLHVPFKTTSKKPKQNIFIPEYTIHVNGDPLQKVAGHVTTFDTFMADHASDTDSPLLNFFEFLVSTIDIVKDIEEDYEGEVIDPALDDVLDEIFQHDYIEISNQNLKHIGSPNSTLAKDMQEDYEDEVIDPTLDDILDEIFENDGVEMLDLNVDKNVGSPNSILTKDMEKDHENKVVDPALDDVLDEIFENGDIEISDPNVDKHVGSQNSILAKDVEEDHEDEVIDPTLDDVFDEIFENDDIEPTIVLLH